ncbi:MAG: hypothetical protein ABL871_16715 [Terricaulis sp.]
MFKRAFIVIAMASLSACASLDLQQTDSPLRAYESFDAAPVEPALIATLVLHRRAFTPPSQKQPEFRAIAVTAFDRLRRRSSRRRRRRR